MLMTTARQNPATDYVTFDIDARTVRNEAIRAIRGFAHRSERPVEWTTDRRGAVSFYSIVRIMRDLELTLMAISGSLAEGVEHATGSSSASRLNLDHHEPQSRQKPRP